MLGAAPASAATYSVCNSGCHFSTIQAAVDGSVDFPTAPGDTIDVRPGTYRELVTVDKRLEIRGPQAGVDARTRAGGGGGEAVLVPDPSGSGTPVGFHLTASDVTINGFRIEGSKGPGIEIHPTVAGSKVLYNIVSGNANGIRLNGPPSATTRTFIQFNRLDRNNDGDGVPVCPPVIPTNKPPAGCGILSDKGISNVEISSNLFSGHRGNGIQIAGPAAPAALSEGIDVVGNKLSDDSGMYFRNARSLNILGNAVLKPGRVQFSGITLGGDVNGVVIRQNRLIGQAKKQIPRSAAGFDLKDTGVLVSNVGGDPNLPNGQVQVIGNTITDWRRGIAISGGDGSYAGELKAEFNRIVRNSRGINNTDPSATELIDADNNWWGCNQGPGDDLNRCQNVSVNVNADPWLTLRISTDKEELGKNGDSTNVIGSVLRNSAGDTPLSFFPDRTALGFSATKGRIRKRARTLNGVARTLFSTTSGGGSAKISVTLDNEKKRAKVDISGGGGGGGGGRDNDRDRDGRGGNA